MVRSALAALNVETGNRSRRERKNLQQRREILQAALGLFSEKGYNNVSMHEIAKKAEFGMGTLYKYFNNKEELYKALIMEVFQEHHNAFVQSVQEEPNPLRAVTRFILVRRKLFLDNLPIVRLYCAGTRGASFNIKAGLDQDLLVLHDKGIKQLASVFKKGIENHVFREVDPYQMARALDGLMNTVLFQFITHPDRVHEDDILSVVDIFFTGVLNK